MQLRWVFCNPTMDYTKFNGWTITRVIEMKNYKVTYRYKATKDGEKTINTSDWLQIKEALYRSTEINLF